MSETADKPKVPELRFPEFEGVWTTEPLNKAFREKKSRNLDGRFTKSNVLSVSGDVGVVNQIEHMGRSYAGVSVLDYHVVEQGDVVYTKSPLKLNPFGIIKTNHGRAGIVSTLYAVYEVQEQHDPNFWGRYFELDDRTNQYLMPLVHKGAKNDMKISNSRVLIDPVTYPLKAEQERIAAFFDAIDQSLECLSRKHFSLGCYKSGIMQRLFSQELSFTREDGSPFPDWEEKRLGDLVDFASGGTPSKDEEAFWAGDIPWISASSMKGTSYSASDLCLTELGARNGTRLVPAGTILILVRGSMLYNKVPMGISARELAFNQDVKALLPKSDQTAEFLLFQLLSNEHLLLSRVVGTGIGAGKLDTDELKRLAMPAPHPDEQKKIVGVLSAIDDRIDAVAKQIEAMQCFKKSLLQQMFV